MATLESTTSGADVNSQQQLHRVQFRELQDNMVLIRKIIMKLNEAINLVYKIVQSVNLSTKKLLLL